jgi:hypothetical protein
MPFAAPPDSLRITGATSGSSAEHDKCKSVGQTALRQRKGLEDKHM